MRACCTARAVASPAAQDLREPVLGAWRYARSAPPSSQAVETVFERKDALDFVSFDHRDEDVAHGEPTPDPSQEGNSARGQLTCLFPSLGGVRGGFVSAHKIRHGQNGAEIVGGMTPFCREPRVVEIEPA